MFYSENKLCGRKESSVTKHCCIRSNLTVFWKVLTFPLIICEILYKLLVAIFTAVVFNSFDSSSNIMSASKMFCTFVCVKNCGPSHQNRVSLNKYAEHFVKMLASLALVLTKFHFSIFGNCRISFNRFYTKGL